MKRFLSIRKARFASAFLHFGPRQFIRQEFDDSSRVVFPRHGVYRDTPVFERSSGNGTGVSSCDLSPVDWAKSAACPTLVLSGGTDPRAKPWEVNAVFDNLPASTKTLRMFDRAGHVDLFAFDTSGYQREIEAFLKNRQKSMGTFCAGKTVFFAGPMRISAPGPD